uniref:PKD domain-containing protein n=1 Tax=Nocardioides sp. TaxID=35761 RepID=UPI0035686810
PPIVPAGFQDREAIAGLSEPTAVAFAADGTAFVALKTGVIKTFDYDAGSDTFEQLAQGRDFANLDVNVHNYWDRGLTGIALDPRFGESGHNYVYVNYAYNRDPRDNPEVVPKWGIGAGQYDGCPQDAEMGPPPVEGCIVDIRVSRLPATRVADGWAAGAEQVLIEDTCMQFQSHGSGDVAFGPDGYLYASAGDGASFDTEDYGQAGNPCGDPVEEGGALRAQDSRTSGDPLGLNGAVFRIDPATGLAPGGTDDNAARLVTYGQRNPWRLSFRPGTSELWSVDVGSSGWEEINRTDMASFTAAINRGWPCYEGGDADPDPAVFDAQSQVQAGYDSLDLALCEDLYAEGSSAVAAPYFAYPTRGAGTLTPGEACEVGTSSVSGTAFIPASGTATDYPAQYRGALFFNDYARGCVWHLGKLPNGDPDPARIFPFVQRAESPVSVRVGPGGDLYYVDYGIVDGNVTPGAGAIHRVVYTPGNQSPVAALSADRLSGPAPLTVNFDAGGSTDGDGDPLTYEWSLDGDGVFDDGGGATKSRTYPTPGNVTVKVRVSDGRGGVDTEQVTVSPGNSAPTLTSVSPASSLTWAVGDTIDFAATATDAQQDLPDSAYTWQVAIQHCPSVCHTHGIATYPGTRTGSFTAPDHEYPSNLLLNVTVTDDQGLTDSESVQIDPKSVAMNFATSPSGGPLTIAGSSATAPHSQTFIVGSGFNVSVPATRTINGAEYEFASWSDGGARTHAVVAPANPATLTATYARRNRLPTATLSADPSSGIAPLQVDFTAGATDPDGDNSGFTYLWALDGDGVFNDGGGTTKTKTYSTPGTRQVSVRVTDSHGGQDTASTTVTVAANQPPVASLVADPDSGPAPLNTTLSAAGSNDPDGGALDYAWDLDDDGAHDDGGTASTQAASFSAVGTHVVRVRVRDPQGASATASAVVTVTNRNPTVLVSADPASGPAPLTTTFTAQGSDPDGTPLSYAWDLDEDGQFDDGGTASTQAATYGGVGVHRAWVRVTDAHGGTATAFATVMVTNRPPSAALTADPTSGRAPVNTMLSAAGSSDPDGGALSYAWDLDGDGQFDDGGTASTQAATFSTVGEHSVGVRVTDPDGGTGTATTTVTVENTPPTARIDAGPTSGPAPLEVDFDGSGSGDPDGPITFDWDLDGDGEFGDSDLATPSATYDIGTFTVRLRVTDAHGATTEASIVVHAGNTAPQLGPLTPEATDRWSVGEQIDFAASATDEQDGALPEAAFTWTIETVACESGCDPVLLDTVVGASSGSVTAPDLDYPAHLLLTVLATDSGGLTDTHAVRLDPLTVDLGFASNPPGLAVPFDRRVIVGATVPISVAQRQADGARLYDFVKWSDGGPRSHDVVAPPQDTTLVATYSLVQRKVVFRTGPKGLKVKVDGTVRRDRWKHTYDVGTAVRVVAPKHQWRNGKRYVFARWSDGRGRKHVYVVPASRSRLTAFYRRVR